MKTQKLFTITLAFLLIATICQTTDGLVFGQAPDKFNYQTTLRDGSDNIKTNALLLIVTAPYSFNYQAVIRDASGNIKSNTSVTISIAILQGSTAGTVVYSETHSVTTNAFGLVNLQIGNGIVTIGSIAAIDWSAGPYFIKISVDGTEMGTSQLLSVPYALYAAKAGNGFSGSYNDLTDKPTIPTSLSQITPNAGSRAITNVTTPVNNTDAANKAYVDALLTRIAELEALTTKLKDSDGNLYNVVKIGTQVWMAENLKTTKYNDGTAIPLVTDNTAWAALTGPAYCWRNNDEVGFKYPYGALYNWYTVNTGNLCPTGWHIPSDAELTTLVTYLGGESVAGGKMKETGTTHWNSPNTGATNESSFTALPGGYRHSSGSFSVIGDFGYCWSSTEATSTTGWFLYVHYNDASITRTNQNKLFGFSVRCIKD